MSYAALTQSKTFDYLDTTCEVQWDPRCHHVPGDPCYNTGQNPEELPSSRGSGTDPPQSLSAAVSCISASSLREAEQHRSEDYWGKILVPMHH